MLWKHFIALLSAATAISASTRPRLVPSKRALAFDRRSLWKRDIVPKDAISLNYAESPYHPPSATVSLLAQDGRPILLVEDFDHLLNGVSCSSAHNDPLGDAIALDFSDELAYQSAVAEWKYLQDFAVITSHPGCNMDDERGAWVVSSVLEDVSGWRLTFLVEPVAMRDIIKSFGVKYNHNGARSWAAAEVVGLSRRDEHGEDTAFNVGFNPDLGSRLPLFPPNTTLDDGVSEALISQLTDAQIDLTCVDCTFNTNITIGLDFEVDVGNSSCVVNANESCFTFNGAAMNFTIEQFEQDAALEIFIGKEIQAGTDYKILSIPVGPALNIPSLIDLGPTVGLEVAFELDISSSINFTFGAKAHIPSGAFASVSLVNSTGDWDPTATATGWDGSGVDQIPFRVNDGQFNISTSMAFAPYAEISFTILDVGAALRIIENMPKVGMNAGMRTAVNRDCNPIGADDFESFGTAFVVGSGMTLSTEAQLVLEKGEFVGNGIPDNWDFSLWSHDVPFTPSLGINASSCFVLSDDGLAVNTTNNAVLVAERAVAGEPAPTGTLLAAASAIPTWDMNKIESYYSANGHLPTNVNYGQMIQATTVPTNLQSAVTQAADGQNSTSAAPMGRLLGGWNLWAASSVLMGAFIAL